MIIKLENDANVKDVDFGKLNGSSIQTVQLNSNDLLASKYKIRLNYKNIESLAFNEQFTFTENSMNLTFVDVDSTIALTSCKNIFNVNETNSVELIRQNPFLSSLSPFVKCKLGDKYVPTIRISDSKYICNVTTMDSGVNQLSLWYVNSDAKDNEILISPNHLTMIFVEKIQIDSVNPFTSLISTPTTTNLFTNFKFDIFKGNVTYRCKFGNDFYLQFSKKIEFFHVYFKLLHQLQELR